MARHSRRTVLRAEGGDQKWQRSSGIPRQVRVQTSHRSFVLSLLAERVPKSMAICAVRTATCLLGSGMGQNTMPEIKTGSCWLQRCHDGRTGGSDGPPCRPLPPGVAEGGRCRQRSKATGLSKPFLKWPFIQPWPPGLRSSDVLVALVGKGNFSPLIKTVWTSYNTGTNSVFPGLILFSWKVWDSVFSSFYFPVKSDLDIPGHCANLFFHSPEYPISPSYIYIYAHIHP